MAYGIRWDGIVFSEMDIRPKGSSRYRDLQECTP